MRLTQLRSFHAVASSGGFTKGAEQLHVSQPTITTQVRSLEDSYHVELFHRRGRRVYPTELGNRLLQLSRQIFSLEAEARQLLGDAGELRSGHLRVAAVGPYHVTKMLALYNRRYPGITVSVSTGNSQDVLERLLDYRADVGVLAQVSRDRRCVALPYSEHPIVVLVPAGHRFAKRRSLRIAELAGEPLILREQGSTTRKAFEAALKAAKVEPKVVMEIGSREIIREAVVQGIGLAAVSAVEFVPGPGLQAVKLADGDARTFAHVVCLGERRDMRMVRSFFDVIESAPPAKRV
jgi:aminoethylphosphonate catabolism LysR family transcriptional regulator